MTKDEMTRDLFKKSKQLLDFLEKHDVFDECADDGDGRFDTWESDGFSDVKRDLKEAIENIQNSLF